MAEKKRIPIGIENYKEMLDKNYYYADKTLLIKELIDAGTKVTLFMRPRRFGKTLTLNMLKTFFECEWDRNGNRIDNSRYFKGKAIDKTDASYMEYQGKYPVIHLSLKSAKQPDFEMAYRSLLDEIAKEYERHRYVLTGEALSESNKKRYQLLMDQQGEAVDNAKALEFLSECLSVYHGERTIILIDEYDVPLENAYFCGFYTKMIDFIRSLFESALKTNDHLEFAVITGCLRISKESIFTGLNNLKMVSVLNKDYAEYFGFTETETKEILYAYGIEEKFHEVKKWYNGYLFGQTNVYNPWSVINYVETAVLDPEAFPKPYWSNTSSNHIVRELVERSTAEVKQEIEELIKGGSIERPVHEDITYEDIYKNQDNLWNFLFFTGYLKAEEQRFEIDTIYLKMSIPNEEIRYIYRNTIQEWFREQIEHADKEPLYQALLTGNCEKMAAILRRQLMASISYYDNLESFYHGYLLGLLSNIPDYIVRSNKEAGNGRPDIQIVPFELDQAAYIIEIKKTDRYEQMEEKCKNAIEQIKRQQYGEKLKIEGYQTIYGYGICFCKKNCMIKMMKID